MPIEDTQDAAFARLVSGKLDFDCTAGIHEREGSESHGGGLTNADIGAFHEFGLGVPERSWLRAWFDENQSQIGEWQVEYIEAVTTGADPKTERDIFAVKVETSIKQRILAGVPGQPLSKAVKARRGPDAIPLIDSAQMLGSIRAIAEQLLQ